jgi:hypothetical protein
MGHAPAHRGSSVACAGSLTPITAASTISGCWRRTLSSSAGGTATTDVSWSEGEGSLPAYLGSPIAERLIQQIESVG